MKINTWLRKTSLLIKKKRKKEKGTCRKEMKSQENFKINPAEASEVKSALIKFHVQRLSRFLMRVERLVKETMPKPQSCRGPR